MVDLDGLALHQHRLEGLDAEAVQRGCPVEEHRVLLDDVLEDVPDLRAAALDHALGRLDVLGQLAIDQRLHHEEIGRAHSELQSIMRISYAVFCLKKQHTTTITKLLKR